MQDSACSNVSVARTQRARSHTGLAEADYRQFADVSWQLTAGYARLTATGMPPSAVATAMLGAAVNFHECFGMAEELPATLRALADWLEQPTPPS